MGGGEKGDCPEDGRAAGPLTPLGLTSAGGARRPFSHPARPHNLWLGLCITTYKLGAYMHIVCVGACVPFPLLFCVFQMLFISFKLCVFPFIYHSVT